MSEPTVTPEPTTPAATTEPTTQGDPADKPLGPNGEKALKAERDRADAAEKRLKDIETANLSELERAQQAAKDAQEQLTTITRQNLRNSVALAKGVPADLVDFLTGDTEQEIAAKADVLLARIQTGPSTPRPDLTQSSTRDPAATAGPQGDFAKFLSGQLTK